MPFCMKTTLPTDIELTIPQGTKLMLTLEGNLILWLGISQSHDFPEWLYIGMNLALGFSHLIRSFTWTV